MTESALGPRRLPFIILASLLILYSCTGLLVDVRGQSNPVVVSQLCRVFVCAENLELQHAYGRFWPEQENSKLLEAAVRQSLIRNPAYPYRWCDLGDVLLASGQTAAARYSFERASQLGPDVPPVLLRLMNFYFRIAENRLALAAASRVLQDTGQYDAIVFSTYARLGLSTGDILRDGVPVQPRPARAFFSHAMSTRPVSETLLAWTWLTSHALADDGLAATFADSLLAQHYYEDAARSWASYVGEHQSGYRKSNFVFNGDFENAWSASPFEWRVAALDGVDVERDEAAARAGRWSLRIRFDGRHNLDYHHISQRVAVSPGAYVLQADIRANGIGTDQGIAFRILDAEAPSRLDVTTAQTRGTSDWTTVTQNFPVPAQTQMLEIQVVRKPSLKFENLLGGTVWIDSIRLAPAR